MVQVRGDCVAEPVIRAVDFAGQIARQWSAAVYLVEGFHGTDNFYGCGKSVLSVSDLDR